jgi:hypothetical protein
MAHLVIDRALNGRMSNSWPRWEEMLGNGAASGFIGAPKAAAANVGQSAAAAQSSSASSSAGPAGVKTK